MCIPPLSLWTAAGQVRQPWWAVVAIETSVCAGPRHALQTGTQGTRPDMTLMRVSFYLGRRGYRDGPGLDSAF